MILRADARYLPLRDGCVQCVVTSPPYWGLRDYGSSDQIGLEGTPDAYVASLVAVFAEVWRVLKADGTCWLNLGDTFNSSPSNQHGDGVGAPYRREATRQKREVFGLKPKDLVGIPWRVAFALQAAGWYLRSDIIWAKPNPMPESVTDRPTKAHEYLFLLAKSERYYFNQDAVRLPVSENWKYAGGAPVPELGAHRKVDGARGHRVQRSYAVAKGANVRTVWTVPTMPYSGAHFATFPEALIEPCILAGCPIGGLVCDPFLGSGTVGAVAERLGRRWVGTDLSYQGLAQARTAQRGIPFCA